MRPFMIVLAGLLVAMPGMPEAAAGQGCQICVLNGNCHGFSESSAELCESDPEENPSCRDCSEEPDGHPGCHATECNPEWACSQHGDPSCGIVTEEDQEEQELLVEMATGQVPFDAEAVGALIARRTDVRYNPVRGVIQWLGGCGSSLSLASVVLQVPVPPREVLALELRMVPWQTLFGS